MSRRCHHGSPRHARAMAPGRPPRPRGQAPEAGPIGEAGPLATRQTPLEALAAPALVEAAEPVADPTIAMPEPRRAAVQPRPPVGHEPSARPVNGESHGDGPNGIERVATAPQLRRFIKSRAYVPMHELRRRFAINGGDDDVTPVDVDRSRVYVGLPEREGRLLGELLRGGDIGYELSLDPVTPVVVGVYPMRPVSRG